INGLLVGIEYFLKLSINKWAFICTTTSQLYAKVSDSLVHLFFGNGSSPATSTTSSAGRFSSAHNPSSTVNRTVKRFSTFSRIFSFKDNGNISHTSAYKSTLSRIGSGSSFSNDNLLTIIMCFFASIIMVIVYLVQCFCT